MKDLIKEKEKDLFEEANIYYSRCEFLKALLIYARILTLNDSNHKVYIWMYRSLFNHCCIMKYFDPMLNELFRKAYKYAPKKQKEEYFKMWKMDVQILKDYEIIGKDDSNE